MAQHPPRSECSTPHYGARRKTNAPHAPTLVAMKASTVSVQSLDTPLSSGASPVKSTPNIMVPNSCFNLLNTHVPNKEIPLSSAASRSSYFVQGNNKDATHLSQHSTTFPPLTLLSKPSERSSVTGMIR